MAGRRGQGSGILAKEFLTAPFAPLWLIFTVINLFSTLIITKEWVVRFFSWLLWAVPLNSIAAVTVDSVAHGVISAIIFGIIFHRTFHGRPFPAVAGYPWRFQTRNFAFYGQPTTLALVTGLDELDAFSTAAMAALPPLIRVWGTMQEPVLSPWVCMLLAALLQTSVAVTYTFKYAFDWGYIPNQIQGALRRVTPSLVSTAALNVRLSKPVVAVSRALAWLTTGLKGVAIGLALGWHIQSRPGGLRGAVSDVSEIARGALQRYPRLLALLTSATDSLSRVLSAALLRPSAALARRGSLVLGAIASHGAPGPLAALGVLCGAAMAVHLALTRARDSADDVDGAGADDFRQVAREAGEIPVPAAGSAGVPIDLGKTLEGMGLKARQYGHLPMRIAHEGCGTGMATVVTREVLAEHGARKRGGCFGGFKPPEEVRCLYKHRCTRCGQFVAYYEWNKRGVMRKGSQSSAPMGQSSDRRMDYGGSVMGANLGLLPAGIDVPGVSGAVAAPDAGIVRR